MRLSPNGEHALSTVSGVVLDGELVAPNTAFGDFLTDAITFYGGFNGPTPQLGRYVSPLAPLAPRYIAPDFVSTIQQFWSDGQSRWLLQAADGAHDSDGHHWPDRAAIGSSRQGDWLFVTTPSFTSLITRTAAGQEYQYDFGRYFQERGVWMDEGKILMQPVGDLRPSLLPGLIPVNLPNPIPIVSVNGRLAGGGFIGGWDVLAFCWLDEAPTGYILDTGLNFNPAIAAKANGHLTVAGGATQAEFPQKVYDVDLVVKTASLNGGQVYAMRQINMLEPPMPSVPRFVYPIFTGSFFASR